MTIYTEKTLKFLRDRGDKAQVVEKWQQQSFRRIDLFGIIDIVSMGNKIRGVQSTSYGCRKEHIDKILGEGLDAAQRWIAAGGELYLFSWKKEKRKRGGKAFRYAPVIDRFVGGGSHIESETIPAASAIVILPIQCKGPELPLHTPGKAGVEG